MSASIASPIAPSYRAGFARSADQSVNPQQWKDLTFAMTATLGHSGQLWDIIHNRKGIANGGSWDIADPSWQHTAITDWVELGPSNVILPTDDVTIILEYEKTDGIERESSAFGHANTNANTRAICRVLLPYPGAGVIWDYGGTSGVYRVIAGGLSFGRDIWALTNGSRGLQIWQNGIVVGSNANPADRVLTTEPWYIGRGPWNTQSDLAKYHKLYVYQRELRIDEIRAFANDPFLLHRPIHRIVRVEPTNPPVNTSPPSIAGTPQTGQTLTCTPGTWNPAGDRYAYQWYRADDDQGTGEQAIAGATAVTYTLQGADETKYIRCDETATNSGGSVTAESNYLGPITAPLTPPVNTSPPSIAGTAEVGQTLTCTPGTWDIP